MKVSQGALALSLFHTIAALLLLRGAHEIMLLPDVDDHESEILFLSQFVCFMDPSVALMQFTISRTFEG